MKRLFSWFSLLFAFLLLVFLAPSAAAMDTSIGFSNFKKVNTYLFGQFSDVKSSDWYSDSVAKSYELGLMLGNSKTTFNPTGTITIAESIVLSSRLYSIYHNDGYQFINGDPWYQTYIDYALRNGIIAYGYKDYLQPATRAEFAAILAMALPSDALEVINTIEEGAIPDVSGSDSYLKPIYALYRAGILTGNDPVGTFAPDSNIERGSAAAIVARMADKTLRKSLTLYAPFELSSKYLSDISTGSNVTISKISAQKAGDNCNFTIEYSAKYNKTDYSFYNPPSGKVFMKLGTLDENQSSFIVTIPISDLKQVSSPDYPQIWINFHTTDTLEFNVINIQPLARLWN